MHVSGDLDHFEAAVSLLPTVIVFIIVVLITFIVLLLLIVLSLSVYIAKQWSWVRGWIA